MRFGSVAWVLFALVVVICLLTVEEISLTLDTRASALAEASLPLIGVSSLGPALAVSSALTAGCGQRTMSEDDLAGFLANPSPPSMGRCGFGDLRYSEANDRGLLAWP